MQRPREQYHLPSSARRSGDLDMTKYSESVSLNGAAAYDASLLNPFAFSDEELLLHVTPEYMRNYQHAASSLQTPALQTSRSLHGSDSNGLPTLVTCVDAEEATSPDRPHAAVPDQLSNIDCSPGSPLPMASAAFDGRHTLSHDVIEPRNVDTERNECRDGLEDPADHREKNRVAQKKFRARQKVTHTIVAHGCIGISPTIIQSNDQCFETSTWPGLC